MRGSKSVSETVRAVTFDVGGTLIDPHPSVGHIYAEVAGRHGYVDISPALLNRRFAAAWRRLRNFRHTRAQWAGLVDATFDGLTERPPSRTFFGELYDRFTEAAAWHVYDDVRPALEALAARGLKLGIVSNWDHRLRPLLRGLRLDRYFEVMVISCEVGAVKPARAVFRRAAARLGLPPGAILHVGDSPAMDCQGARAAGMQSVLLRRGAGRPQAGQIRSLRQFTQSFCYGDDIE